MDQPDFPTGFYFKLSLCGEATMFQEVSGLTPDMQVADVSKYSNLILKRGFLLPSAQLVVWIRQILEGDLENAIQTHDLKLSLMKADEAILANWTICEAWPVKWSVSDFKSGDASELAVETLELAYAHVYKNA